MKMVAIHCCAWVTIIKKKTVITMDYYAHSVTIADLNYTIPARRSNAQRLLFNSRDSCQSPVDTQLHFGWHHGTPDVFAVWKESD